MDTAHTEDRNGFRLTISIDPDPMSPRDASTVGVLVIPDAMTDQDYRKAEHAEALKAWDRFAGHYGTRSPVAFRAFRLWAREEYGARVVLPVYYGTHGPMSSTRVGSLADDGSGADGVTFDTADSVRELWAPAVPSVEDLAEALKVEAEEWGRWASGDTYCYAVERLTVCSEGVEHAETVDSCGSFIGREYAEAEAQAAFKAYADAPAGPAA